MRAPHRTQAGCGSILACACLLGAQPSHALEAEGHYAAALVIGNAQYRSVGELKNPEHDADDMCAALRSLGFATTCRKNVATRTLLRAIIEDFVDSLPAGAVSVIYYAGHGLQVKGENYLVPTRVQITDASSVLRQSVDLSFLMDQLRLRHNPGYLTMIILDACRNDPVSSSQRPLPLGLAPITAAGLPDATDVLYATAAHGTAIDGGGRNGTLTKYLLASLDAHIPIDDLFKRVIAGVQSETAHTQTPEYDGNFTGTYCFGGCKGEEILEQQRAELEAVRRKLLEEQRVAQEAQEAAAEAARKQRQPPAVPPVVPLP